MASLSDRKKFWIYDDIYTIKLELMLVKNIVPRGWPPRVRPKGPPGTSGNTANLGIAGASGFRNSRNSRAQMKLSVLQEVLSQGKDPRDPSAQGAQVLQSSQDPWSLRTTGIPVTTGIPGIQVTYMPRCPTPGTSRTLRRDHKIPVVLWTTMILGFLPACHLKP